MPKVLELEGLSAPLALDGVDSIIPLIDQVLGEWPHVYSNGTPNLQPFMSITSADDGAFLCHSTESPAPKRWNALNAVCELVAATSWEQIRANPAQLCIHCAAVEFRGRLVLFPNRRRTGKSQLASILAHRDHRVFTDDFLPVIVSETGHIEGVANGILPRVRMPQPADMSEEFSTWVRDNPGPSNPQYKYLQTDQIAARSTRLRIGAIVLLDREQSARTRLAPVDTATALNQLVVQNFARDTHAARILRIAHDIAQSADLYELRYGNAELAADVLEATFTSWREGAPNVFSDLSASNSHAELTSMDQPELQLDSAAAYVQAPGTTAIEVGDLTYLADIHGLGVTLMNQTSGAIWRLLTGPMTLSGVTQMLVEAFPSVSSDQIGLDCRNALSDFIRNRLIVPYNLAEDSAE